MATEVPIDMGYQPRGGYPTLLPVSKKISKKHSPKMVYRRKLNSFCDGFRIGIFYVAASLCNKPMRYPLRILSMNQSIELTG